MNVALRSLPHRPEAENAVLGGVLLKGREALTEALTVITEEEFYQPRAMAVFRAMRILEERGEPIDVITLEAQLRRTGELELVGGIEGLARLDRFATAHNVKAHAELIAESARVRRTVVEARTIAELGMEEIEDADEFCAEAQRKINAAASTKAKGGPVHVAHTMLNVFDGITERQRNEGQITGVPTGFDALDEMTCGLQPTDLVILAARPSMGKAQPLDAKVLTAQGFRAMGELRIGDQLASIDGAPSKVTGLYPQGKRQVYRVTMADGRSTECCAEHLWLVHYRSWTHPRVLSTETIRSMLTRTRYRNRLWIDTFSGSFGGSEELGIDPWLLGQVIGNGCLVSSTPKLTTVDPDVVERAKVVLDDAGMQLAPAQGWDWSLSQAHGGHKKGVSGVAANPITRALKKLGLHGLRSWEKFIPERVFASSREVRVEVLAGLIDSDGWIERTGAICYGTSSERLATDVVRLMRSVGGTATSTPKRAYYTHKGKKKEGRTAYVCCLQHPDPTAIALTSKRRHRLVARKRQRRLNFVSIEPTRVCDTQCISVSHASRLYVTDDYIVTHNTAFGLNVAEQACILQQKHVHAPPHKRPPLFPVLFFSLEMGAEQLVERVLCSQARADYQAIRRGSRMMELDFRQLISAADRISKSPLYIDDTASLSITQIRERAVKFRNDPTIFPEPDPDDPSANHKQRGLVMIDYLQLARGSKAKYDSREQEISEISRGLKALAKEIRLPVIALSQLNRAVDSRADHRPQLSDLRESGAIEQDADVIMFIYREERYLSPDAPEEKRAAAENKAEIIVGKQRNGPIGTVHLHFMKKHARFVDPADPAEQDLYGLR